MKRILAFSLFATLFFSLWTAAPASADSKEAPPELTAPQKVIADTSEQVRDALRRDNFQVDINRATKIVREILEPHVDTERVALWVLGKHWKSASPDEKERFKTEFRTLLVRSYTTAFKEFKNWTIHYLPMADSLEEKTVMVRTEVLQPSAKPITVNYRLIHLGDEWKVFDVLIEGISLIQNYRTTFSQEIEQSGSLDSVIRTLAQRNAEALKAAPGGK